jgi:hypothetical protein
VALDPYRRKTKAKERYAMHDVPALRHQPRVPLIVSAFGLVAMLALVYYLSVMGIDSKTAQLFAWSIQPPP